MACIADTHAPSQTVPWTRVPVIERLLREDGVLGRSGVFYSANYGGSGSAALLLGEDPHKKRVWLMSHLDVVSHLVEPETDGEYPLTPYCFRLATGDRPGVALEFRPGQGMVPIMTGTIVTAGDQVRFRPERPGELRAGHRVVCAGQTRWDRATGIVEGSLDSAAGATACLLAAAVLAHDPVEVLVSLADEEEAAGGAGNQTLSRGGKRLTHLFAAPDLAVVVDSHLLGRTANGGSDGAAQPANQRLRLRLDPQGRHNHLGQAIAQFRVGCLRGGCGPGGDTGPGGAFEAVQNAEVIGLMLGAVTDRTGFACSHTVHLLW